MRSGLPSCNRCIPERAIYEEKKKSHEKSISRLRDNMRQYERQITEENRKLNEAIKGLEEGMRATELMDDCRTKIGKINRQLNDATNKHTSTGRQIRELQSKLEAIKGDNRCFRSEREGLERKISSLRDWINRYEDCIKFHQTEMDECHRKLNNIKSTEASRKKHLEGKIGHQTQIDHYKDRIREKERELNVTFNEMQSLRYTCSACGKSFKK